MFNLFKKKHPAAQTEEAAPEVQTPAAPAAQHPEAAALAAQFGPEEFDITAVTGANSFGGDREEGAEYWTATLPLIAWREDDGPIRQENTCLVALADDILLDYLRRSAPRDSVIQARVRKGLEDDRFLLVGLPSPVVDREMKAILDRAVEEVSTWVPNLGTFVLNRTVNWFQADVDWLGQSITLTYDNGSEEEQKAAQATALALMGDAKGWDEKLRAFAAAQLPAREPEAEELEGLTGEALARRLEPESIQVWGDGRFEAWYHDADYLWTRSVRVNGTLHDGAADCAWEG